MKKHEQMTKAELIGCLQELKQRAPTEPSAFEYERLWHEVQVHQAELETQNQDLRAAQLLLENSRDRYADLYDFAPVGYVTFDSKGVILEINLTAAGMLGVERTRLVGLPFHRYVAREDQAGLRTHLQTLSDQSAAVELHLAGKDGRALPILMQSALVYDAEKKTHLCRSSLTDVSALKQSEQARQESEARFRQVVENIDEVFWLTDVEKNEMLFISAGYEKIWGRSCESLLAAPRTWLDAVVPEDRERVLRAALTKQVLKEYDEEYRIMRPDGTQRWIHDRAFPIRDAAGKVYRIAGLATDITGRKQAERALQMSEERLRLVLQASETGSFEIDLATGETHWNDIEFALLGLKPGEAPADSETFLRQVHPDDLGRIRAHWEEAKRTGRLDAEFRIVRADGQERWLGVKGRLLTEARAGGEAQEAGRRILGVNFDITERKRLQQELLEISEREQRKFGHDLHDGLGQQLTGLEMLSHNLAEDLKKCAPILAKTARRLNRELRATVTVARRLSHALAPVPMEGDGLMRGLTELAASTSRLAGVRCRFFCDPPVQVPDSTVAMHLYRIAQESVHNALKHGRAKALEITLTQRTGGLELSVINHGRNLPALARRKDGMGLNVMRHRAELIGASLAIEPAGRQGVRITCTLPGKT